MPAPVLRVKRGALSNLPGLKAGEPAFTTDSFDFYVGIDSTTNNNKFVGSHRYWKKETASSGSGVNLVESTSGSDFITLAAPASVGAAITYTFPGTITNGYFLKTNSTGVLSWDAVVSDFNIAADSGSPDTVSTGSTITFTGGTNVNTAVTDNTITINLDNDISVTNLNVSGISTFVGVATFTTNNVYINNQLYVGGLQVTGGASIGEDITARHLSLSGIATVTGLIDANGGLDVTGHTELDNLNASGIATFSNTTDSTSRDNGAVIIEGGVGIEKSVNIGGNIYVSGISTFNGLTITNNNLDVQAHAEIQELSVLGITSISSTLMVDGDILADAGLRVLGITTISDTSDSTNPQNGAFRVNGGAGIQKSLHVGGDIHINGNVTIGGTTVTLKGEDVYIQNKDIILGFTTAISPNDDTANHGGVAIASTVGTPLASFTASGINTLPDTYKQLMWFQTGTLGFSTDAFAFNYGLAIGTTTMANGVRLAVGSGITMSDTSISATNFYGTLNGSITGNAASADQVKTQTAGNTNATYHLTFVDANNGSATNETVYTDDGIYYNPGTNTFTTQYGVFTGDVKTGAVKAADGTSSITINNSTGNVGIASNLVVSGDLYVQGTTTEVNTDTLKVQDPLIDLGLIDNGSGQLIPPTSDLNYDIGVLLNWYSGSAKKAAVYWDDSLGRVGIASDVSEANNVLTASAYAAVEIGALWVTDCAGTSQVISCTGAERFLENITVDAGTF
jgi:hypothetical protein